LGRSLHSQSLDSENQHQSREKEQHTVQQTWANAKLNLL